MSKYFNIWWSDPKNKVGIVSQTKYQPIDTYKRMVEFGWISHKERVLEILRKHTHPIVDTQLQRDADLFINMDAIKEIEEL